MTTISAAHLYTVAQEDTAFTLEGSCKIKNIAVVASRTEQPHTYKPFPLELLSTVPSTIRNPAFPVW